MGRRPEAPSECRTDQLEGEAGPAAFIAKMIAQAGQVKEGAAFPATRSPTFAAEQATARRVHGAPQPAKMVEQ